MGLTFINKKQDDVHVSSCADTKRLTSENINFLTSLGFTITNNGYTGHKTRSRIRRHTLGKRVSHTQPLRFIEIGK